MSRPGYLWGLIAARMVAAYAYHLGVCGGPTAGQHYAALARWSAGGRESYPGEARASLRYLVTLVGWRNARRAVAS